MGVGFDHLLGSSLEKDVAACGASCFEVDYCSYAGIWIRKETDGDLKETEVGATGC